MVNVGGIVSVGGSGGSGGGSGSGIQQINSQTGPNVEIVGVNGVEITSAGNVITVDGAGASGVGGGGSACFSQTFTDQTSLTVTHSLGSSNVVVNVFDSSDNKILVDLINIVDTNNVLLQFNGPQTGKVVIVSCGGSGDSNLCEAKRYALLVS